MNAAELRVTQLASLGLQPPTGCLCLTVGASALEHASWGFLLQDPCAKGRGFIGDYFALAISKGNIYALMVSTHYPSSVTADEGGPIYYQQQVLATVPRSDFGAGY